jgi:hypothetical protein
MIRRGGWRLAWAGLAWHCACCLAAGGAPGGASPAAAAREAALGEALQRGGRFWREIADATPPPMTTSRQLFAYALTLAEARRHPERLERLFSLAAQMQDRSPASPGWGNLKWYWRDPGVTDPNAVEFCMQDAVTCWLRHGPWLAESARKSLEELIRLGIEGCLRHRVPTEYTNIALLNAANLIVLGERFSRREAADEGCRRLDAFCAETAVFGIHEFSSPTYYGADLQALRFLLSHAEDARQREQAAALLRLFWTDIALDWFPPAGRLSGCSSRSYDYVTGLGDLDGHLAAEGWLPPQAAAAGHLEPFGDPWPPPASLRTIGEQRFPRLVRRHWGLLPCEARTNMLYRDVALSSSAAAYGSQDVPLVVDLPGSRRQPRCYFVADGREDPYGKKRFQSDSAWHAKALHLTPFWVAAQRTCDAIGVALYRPEDVAAAEVFHVQSHFVLRRDVDGFWLDQERLAISPAAAIPIPADRALVLRQGTAAVGIRLLWAGDGRGRPVQATFVDDGNAAGCVRLTVDHGRPPPAARAGSESPSGAAFWVRVGSGLKGQADFDAWRRAFIAATATASEVSADRLRLEVPGADGPLSITAQRPRDRYASVRTVPEPCRGVLELDGDEIGRPLLAAVAPLRSFPPGGGPLAAIRVSKSAGVAWQAAAGLVLPGMRIQEDAGAAGGRCVGQPAEALPQSTGSVSWRFEVEEPGRYWLWARVRSPDDKHDSFHLGLLGSTGWITNRHIWKLQPGNAWQWQPLRLGLSKTATPLDLPGGECRLQLRTREAGAWLDRLWLTADPQAAPPRESD